VDRIAINPPAALLGSVNAIVGGRARRYEVENVAGPLSIKCVVDGVATWETASGRFEIGPAGWLVLNDGEDYTITVDSRRPVETFCVFFRRGFVEDAHRAATTATGALLDAAPPAGSLHFAERLHSDCGVREALMRMRERRGDDFALDDALHDVAAALVHARGDVASRVARLPSLRSATRVEIARRLDRAAGFIHGHLDQPLSIASMASAACLSPVSLPPSFRRLLRGDAAPLRHPFAPGARRRAAPRQRAGGGRSGQRLRLRQRGLVHHALCPDVRSAARPFSLRGGINSEARFRKNGETAAEGAGYHRRP
jgi:AraC family transcriptional regulator